MDIFLFDIKFDSFGVIMAETNETKKSNDFKIESDEPGDIDKTEIKLEIPRLSNGTRRCLSFSYSAERIVDKDT